jgi:hypothetical protein
MFPQLDTLEIHDCPNLRLEPCPPRGKYILLGDGKYGEEVIAYYRHGGRVHVHHRPVPPPLLR